MEKIKHDECPVCNIRIDNNYCSQCGIYNTGKKLALSNLISQIFSSIWNLDNALLRTLKQFFLDPNVIITQYTSGYRRYYMDPVRLLLLALFVSGLKIYLDGENLFFIELTLENGIDQELIALGTRLTFFTIFSIVIFSEYKYSFIEHCAINLYAISFLTILEFPAAMIIKYLNFWGIIYATKFAFVIFTIYIVCNAYVGSQDKRKLLKKFLIYTLSIIGILGSIAVLLYAYAIGTVK